MSKQNIVKNYLEEEPKFRERKNKDRGIVNLLMRKYGNLAYAINKGFITKDDLTNMVQDYATMDRAWRKTLEEVPSLRGTDYDQKDMLEANKMRQLGYNIQLPQQVEAVQTEMQPTLI